MEQPGLGYGARIKHQGDAQPFAGGMPAFLAMAVGGEANGAKRNEPKM